MTQSPGIVKKLWRKYWARAPLFERMLLIAIIMAFGLGVQQIGSGFYIKAKARLAQHLLDNAWVQTQVHNSPHKPWPWADTWPVARLVVPRLNKQIVVLKGASGQAMAFAPGHMAGTPEPGGNGTTIFAAHRDTHFRFLQYVKAGDRVNVSTADGKKYEYRVTGTEIVKANASGIEPNLPGRKLALVTCYPFGERLPGPLRYVVHAEAISNKETQMQ
jgi:sortase A